MNFNFLVLLQTGVTELIAWTWIDRNRRMFIGNKCGLSEGAEIFRERYRQTSDDPNARPEQVAIQVKQPLAIETFYAGAGLIDFHNRVRAAELRIDKALLTKDWARRANLGIFGIIVVDTYFLYNQVVHPDHRDSTTHEFFSKLADEMIDNPVGVRQLRSGVEAAAAAPQSFEPILRPTIKTKPNAKNKTGSPKLAQGSCQSGCGKSSTLVCSACTHPTDPAQKQFWFCNLVKNGVSCDCFEQHKRKVHGMGNDDENNND